ncbi:hypothetical protein [Nocardia neocaledoniensis]|uniref:hypothetical protein n=1 Tax=Nocardia neocaledoniensis TaxID=236511 RepID=UPI002454DC08|nr:hypothetical protein [Nocardia neocaledoniensis]
MVVPVLDAGTTVPCAADAVEATEGVGVSEPVPVLVLDVGAPVAVSGAGVAVFDGGASPVICGWGAAVVAPVRDAGVSASVLDAGAGVVAPGAGDVVFGGGVSSGIGGWGAAVVWSVMVPLRKVCGIVPGPWGPG